MLHELRVGNLALVDDLALSLNPGLTILTGETGAGKSLIAGALSLLAGGKAGKDFIRQGEDMGFVEGVFDLTGKPVLAEKIRTLGIRVADDGVLVLRRELRKEGRGRVLINGLMSSLSLLEQLGQDLLSVQSQDQQRILSQGGFARDFLDAVLDLGPLRGEVALRLSVFNDLSRQLTVRSQEEEFARQQLEMWEFQLRELDEAGLSISEEESLAEKIALGRNSRSLLDGAAHARQVLSEGETNASQLLGSAAGALRPVAGSSPRLEAILSLLQEAQTLADEGASDLERFLDSVEIDPARLDELEERQSLYATLQRKYDRDIEGLLDLREDLALRVQRQKSAASDMASLAQECGDARARLTEAALELRGQRMAGCKKVAARARDLIRPLALPELDLNFEIDFRTDPEGAVEVQGKRCKVTVDGLDVIKLLCRTNRGEAYGEVGKIASGGEKSRIYLGLSVLAGAGKAQPLLLFDEIDAGLGMDNAVPVAGLLTRLAQGGQVLCITHLPTVAAHGNHHLKVAKAVHDERTSLTVRPVESENRVEEIARLLGGEMAGMTSTESQLTYARQLLASEFRQGKA